MGHLKPTGDQFREFLATPMEGPVHMLNLMKFAPTRSNDTPTAGTADGDSGGDSGGEGQYMDYGRAVAEMIEARGGRVVWMGRPHCTFIGGEHDDWDMAAIIEYPGKDAFIEMISNPDYAKISGNRSGGLVNSALIPCKPLRG